MTDDVTSAGNGSDAIPVNKAGADWLTYLPLQFRRLDQCIEIMRGNCLKHCAKLAALENSLFKFDADLKQYQAHLRETEQKLATLVAQVSTVQTRSTERWIVLAAIVITLINVGMGVAGIVF